MFTSHFVIPLYYWIENSVPHFTHAIQSLLFLNKCFIFRFSKYFCYWNESLIHSLSHLSPLFLVYHFHYHSSLSKVSISCIIISITTTMIIFIISFDLIVITYIIIIFIWLSSWLSNWMSSSFTSAYSYPYYIKIISFNTFFK